LPADLPAALAELAGPTTLMVVGSNGAAVARTPAGEDQTFRPFVGDPGTLVNAAASVGMRVCSVEMDRLALPQTTDPAALSIPMALARCDDDDLGDTLARLRQLQTPSTRVVIGANTAATVYTTSNAINYFYDEQIGRLLRAARRLYVRACIIAPASLALPDSASYETRGLSIDDALANCGW
jgi:hypothetical protein